MLSMTNGKYNLFLFSYNNLDVWYYARNGFLDDTYSSQCYKRDNIPKFTQDHQKDEWCHLLLIRQNIPFMLVTSCQLHRSKHCL